MVNSIAVKSDFDKSLEHLKEELRKLKAGRANPDLVKDIKVEAYGSLMTLEQVANINVADATLLTVQPWDKSLVGAVVKALQSSDLGINPAPDGELIRLPIPALTSERREEYIKLMKEKLEDARISIRQKRKEYMEALDAEKSKGMSEDEYEREEKEIQRLVEDANKAIDHLGDTKEAELREI